MKSIKQLIKEVEAICTAHAQVKSFHYGEVARVLNQFDIEYTTVIMNVVRSGVNRDSNDISIELLVLDKTTATPNDQILLDVENTTYRIIRDIVNTIGYSTRWRLFSDLLAQGTTQKIYDTTADKVSGHSLSLTLKMYSDESICDLPMFDYDFDQPIPVEECDVLAIVQNSEGTPIVSKIVTDSDNLINIPDIQFTDSDGTTTSQPSGVDLVCTPQNPCADATVSNSNDSYSTTVASGGNLELPDIDFTDSDGTTTSVPSMESLVCAPMIANDVALRFIKAHETASGYPMDLHQKQVINNFCLMLKGIGTPNKTDLLTRFVNDGTVLFPLAPTTDNTAYLPSFEIDLISGTKQGQYVNMTASNIDVYGALADANGQYFEIFKTGQDYILEPGYTFGYTKELCSIEVVAMFGNSADSLDMIRLIPRSTAGGGWSYPYWNGATGVATGPGGNALGQLGVFKRASGVGEVYTTYKTGEKIVDSGNNSPAPTNRSINNMWFHTSFGWTANHFKTRISMYCTGVQFTENEDTAFEDLSSAVEYYQDNILSNGTRKWQ